MANFQTTVTVDSNLLKFTPGEIFTLPLIYNTSNGNAALPGISLKIHYNSLRAPRKIDVALDRGLV